LGAGGDGKLNNVQSNLAKGRIAVNAFVGSVRWAGTFARSGRRKTRNALK